MKLALDGYDSTRPGQIIHRTKIPLSVDNGEHGERCAAFDNSLYNVNVPWDECRSALTVKRFVASSIVFLIF